MVLQCLGAWAPFLLITFGPMLAIKIFVRPTLPRAVMLWAWRVWFVGLSLTVLLIVGGVMWQASATSSVSTGNLYYGMAGASPASQQAAVARLSADGTAPAAYLQLVYRIAAEQGSRVEPELVMGIIRQESNWNANATSYAGAMGLMQLMPGTAADMGVADAYDPEQNIRGGVKYITWLMSRYNGDERQAVMAYHAGPGNLESRGPTSLDLYYAEQVLGFYEDYRAKASVGLMQPYGVDSGSCEIGPLYEYAFLTQGTHGRDYGHNAIDLKGGPGTPLYSPIDGEVTEKYIDGLGNTVLVIEDSCWTITLMHGEWKAQQGDQVQQGELIGWEDNYGNTWSGGRPCHGRDGCGDHTHVNIFSKALGRNVDPLQYDLVQGGLQ